MSALALIAGISLCIVGGALIVWCNKEFGEDPAREKSGAGEETRAD
ncbi:MAG: hypothetical protein HC814_05130 [Rhodobacteraceae bacterium]|nr:hypothetical protein [Paracoccaceae bacterium]